MTQELPPFTCTYTQGFPKLLYALKSSIAISTYQAGKLIFISPKNETDLIQFPRTFRRAMGIALHDNRMAVASANDVTLYHNIPGAASNYPRRPQTYDALYLPRANFYTGELDIHDVQFTDRGIMAVNTRFSCVSIINENFSFTPIWQPSFVKELHPDDCCHLNGMAIENGKPKYVTALGKSAEVKGWRPTKANGGILMDGELNEIILDGLSMPHSPRIYKEGLYVLISGMGELVRVDTGKHSYEVLYRFDGFVRGMDRIGDFLFIGLSKLRTTSKSFGDLPIASKSLMAGVAAFHLPSAKVVGFLKYETSVEEIFDVKVMPGVVRPGILSIEKDEHDGVISTPEGVYWPIRKSDN